MFININFHVFASYKENMDYALHSGKFGNQMDFRYLFQAKLASPKELIGAKFKIELTANQLTRIKSLAFLNN